MARESGAYSAGFFGSFRRVASNASRARIRFGSSTGSSTFALARVVKDYAQKARRA